jgi:isopenicillin N synthase-like dioxygenase
MKHFFNSNESLKNSVKRSQTSSRGYANEEYTKRLMDRKEVFDLGSPRGLYDGLSEEGIKNQNLDGKNIWPSHPEFSTFKQSIEAYYVECEKLADILITAIMSSLDCIDVAYVKQHFEHHSSMLRLNYYPLQNSSNYSIIENTVESDGESKLLQSDGFLKNYYPFFISNIRII